MAPAPKNKNTRLKWRRLIARGVSPYRAARLAPGKTIFFHDGSDATSLDRNTRGAE
jgi:hypothetical protein